MDAGALLPLTKRGAPGNINIHKKYTRVRWRHEQRASERSRLVIVVVGAAAGFWFPKGEEI